MRPPKSEKDLLAALVRLIEEDGAFDAINRVRQQTDAEPAACQSEEAVRMQEDLVATQGGAGARVSLPQGGYTDLGNPVAFARAPARGAAPYDDGQAHSDGLRRRGRSLTWVATVAGLVLVGCTGVFGYFAWFSEPRNIAESLTKLIPHKSLGDEEKQRVGQTNENNVGTSEAAAPRGPETELKPAPSTRLLPLTRESSYGVATTQSTAQTGTPSGADARRVRSGTVPANEPAIAPARQVVDPPPQAATSGALPAPPKDQDRPTPSGDSPAPVISTATSASRESSARSPQSPASGKSYVVQLSSQRTEKTAQATVQALQVKYQKILGEHQPFIRRSDLREKGVYFRALVGPFATIGEANQFCGNLKKAGGECVVQKN